MSLVVTAVPAFADNYIWLVSNGRSAVIVDPGDAAGPGLISGSQAPHGSWRSGALGACRPLAASGATGHSHESVESR